MNELKKMLKTQAKDALPDPSVKERVRRELGIAPAPAEEQAYAHGGTRSANKKGIVLCILLPVLLSGGGAPLSPTLSAAGDFYAYSAASAGAVLAQSETAANALRLRRALTEEEKNTIRETTDEYLRLVENLLSENAITHEAAAVPEAYARYDYAMAVTCHGLAGSTFTYTLYYSEALADEETDGGETERAYDITGVLAVDGTDYPVRGGREFLLYGPAPGPAPAGAGPMPVESGFAAAACGPEHPPPPGPVPDRLPDAGPGDVPDPAAGPPALPECAGRCAVELPPFLPDRLRRMTARA